jgi:hypothetical protein
MTLTTPGRTVLWAISHRRNMPIAASPNRSGAGAALYRGLRAPPRCFTEPLGLKYNRDSPHRWMKRGAQTRICKVPMPKGPKPCNLKLTFKPDHDQPLSRCSRTTSNSRADKANGGEVKNIASIYRACRTDSGKSYTAAI